MQQKKLLIYQSFQTYFDSQEHFYFETHASAVEFRDNDITVTTSTQGVTETQIMVGEVIGYAISTCWNALDKICYFI